MYLKHNINSQKRYDNKRICAGLPIIILLLILIQTTTLIIMSASKAYTFTYSGDASLNQDSANRVLSLPIGIVDPGKLYHFNTSAVLGHAFIYSISFENNTKKSFTIDLVGILETALNHYYMLENTLTLNETSNKEYSYKLTDNILNISSNTSTLTVIAGSGTIQQTSEGAIYSYTLYGNTPITIPFEFTPSIVISHTTSTTLISFYSTIQTLTPQTLVYQGKQDTAAISGSDQFTSSITVGGANPINTNLIELVLGSTTNQSTNLYNVDGCLQLFYQKSNSLQPVPEAVSSGAYIQGEVSGVNAYPIYNNADPIVLLSSTINSFPLLWPLNQTTITLTTEGNLALQVNGTSINLTKGTYQFPQYSAGLYLKNVLRLTPPDMTGEAVRLSAPQYIQPQSDSRGVFEGWNNTYKSYTLELNLTRSMTISVEYKPQYLVKAIYANQNGLSIIGSHTEWVNASEKITVSFPSTVYMGKYTRYIFASVRLNSQLLNQTQVNITVTSPINLFGYYTEQYLISFSGPHEKYYSRLNLWANASSRVNITLPQYIQDGAYARLAFYSYTFENKTYTSPQIYIQLLSPVNITLNYTQEYQVNFTGAYSEYLYALSRWYNQGQNYSVMIPPIISVNSTFRLIYDFSMINSTTINTTYLTGVVNSPVIIQLKLTPQYLVDISGPNISIHGFFNKSQIITVQAPYYTGNIFRLDVFKEWRGTVNTTNTQLTLNINGPTHEVAVYKITYIRLLLIVASVGAIITAAIAVYIVSKRSKIFLP